MTRRPQININNQIFVPLNYHNHIERLAKLSYLTRADHWFLFAFRTNANVCLKDVIQNSDTNVKETISKFLPTRKPKYK